MVFAEQTLQLMELLPDVRGPRRTDLRSGSLQNGEHGNILRVGKAPAFESASQLDASKECNLPSLMNDSDI